MEAKTRMRTEGQTDVKMDAEVALAAVDLGQEVGEEGLRVTKVIQLHFVHFYPNHLLNLHLLPWLEADKNFQTYPDLTRLLEDHQAQVILIQLQVRIPQLHQLTNI